MPRSTLKLAVLVSGRGSNFEAVQKAIMAGELNAEIVCLLSNNAGVKALDLAAHYGVPSLVVPSQGLDRDEHEQRVLAALAPFAPQFLLLAGYMRILTSRLLEAFRTSTDSGDYFRVINIHPSLLPAFPGKNGYLDAWEAQVPVSGVTVHLVDELVDHGPIIAQRSFAREPGDDLESFGRRGLAIEHALLPQALGAIAEHGICLQKLPYIRVQQGEKA
jgi:formyltetrahydrofolate-dependent phosphoribosylglycinamide formyltransferase